MSAASWEQRAKTRPRFEREPWWSSEMRKATPHRSSAYSRTAVINGAGRCTVRSMLIMAGTRRNQAPLAFGQASNPTKSPRLSPSTAPGIRRLEHCSLLSPQKAGRKEWETATARMNPTHTPVQSNWPAKKPTKKNGRGLNTS